MVTIYDTTICKKLIEKKFQNKALLFQKQDKNRISVNLVLSLKRNRYIKNF
jgi:hypothetical protein